MWALRRLADEIPFKLILFAVTFIGVPFYLMFMVLEALKH